MPSTFSLSFSMLSPQLAIVSWFFFKFSISFSADTVDFCSIWENIFVVASNKSWYLFLVSSTTFFSSSDNSAQIFFLICATSCSFLDTSSSSVCLSLDSFSVTVALVSCDWTKAFSASSNSPIVFLYSFLSPRDKNDASSSFVWASNSFLEFSSNLASLSSLSVFSSINLLFIDANCSCFIDVSI